MSFAKADQLLELATLVTARRMTDEPDGALTVRFHAGGLLQITHHLMTWGPTVTILEPAALQDLMRKQVEALHAHYAGAQETTVAA